MIGLTAHQQGLLSYLKRYVAENGGVAPSYAEMREAVGLASKSGINRLIVALEERGLIRRLAGKARAIEIVEPFDPAAVSDDVLAIELQRRGWTCLPPLRPGSATTVPGRPLPEPSAEPPAEGGSGPSDVSPFHVPEVTDV
jgi:SOS-response transcriptional repressor LexA